MSVDTRTIKLTLGGLVELAADTELQEVVERMTVFELWDLVGVTIEALDTMRERTGQS